MDSFDDNSWDLLDYSSFIDDITNSDLNWADQSAGARIDVSLSRATLQQEESTEKECTWKSAGVRVDVSLSKATLQDECIEKECTRKRSRSDSCSGLGNKACREKLRRVRLNERFLELSSILEPGKPVKTDKLAILGDAIRVLNQLRAESREFEETNEKLLEEIRSLKAEKNELREEKLVLKADKEKMEQQLKAVAVSPAGFMPAPPAAYHAGANKTAVFPSYGFVPMWQYLPPASLDTTQDQTLRPPAA